MKNKIFTAIFLGVSVLFSGCGDEGGAKSMIEEKLPVEAKIPNFKTKTVNGDEVTQNIFANKKISVVNIWGTYCPPCIGEMPELGDWARSISPDAQIIGLVCDAKEGSEQVDKAKEILKEANADFVNIIPDDTLIKFMENVNAVPTTIFVNSKGEVVGKAVIGADVATYKTQLQELLK